MTPLHITGDGSLDERSESICGALLSVHPLQLAFCPQAPSGPCRHFALLLAVPSLAGLPSTVRPPGPFLLHSVVGLLLPTAREFSSPGAPLLPLCFASHSTGTGPLNSGCRHRVPGAPQQLPLSVTEGTGTLGRLPGYLSAVLGPAGSFSAGGSYG